MAVNWNRVALAGARNVFIVWGTAQVLAGNYVMGAIDGLMAIIFESAYVSWVEVETRQRMREESESKGADDA